MPRPAFQATPAHRKQVEALAAYGVPEDEISKIIGCSPKTLRKYFREQLDTAHAKANARVAESLFKLATNGNVVAAIFWLKTRARWRESPQEVEVEVQATAPTVDARAELLERMRRLAGDESARVVALVRPGGADD